MKYSFTAMATVSCWTEVEADSLQEAIKEAESRDLSGLCHMPYVGDQDQEWHFDSDGIPFNITAED